MATNNYSSTDIQQLISLLTANANAASRLNSRNSTPGRNTVGITDRSSRSSEELRAQKSLLESLLDMSDATKSFTTQLGSLERATENFSNKHLDSISNSILGLSRTLTSGGDRMATSINNTLQSFADDPRNLLGKITDFGSALDDIQRNLREQSIASFAEIARNFTAGSTNPITAASRLYEQFKTLEESADKLQAGLSDIDQDIFIRFKAGATLTAGELHQLAIGLERSRHSMTSTVNNLKEAIKPEIAGKNLRVKAETGIARALKASEFTLIAFTAALAKATLRLAEEYRMVAAAGLQHNFANLSVNALGLGVSTEKLTKIYREHSRTLLTLGVGSFDNALTRGVSGLNELGVFGEAAANGAAAFAKNAIDSGIDPRNKKELDRSIKQQTKAFEHLRSVTGATIEEFNSLNEGLLSNTTNQQVMLRFDSQERAARFNELVSLRKEFAMRGLSAKAADAMVQAMQGFEKNKFKDRYEASARLQQLGGILGMGAQGQRAGQLALKRNKSADEKFEFANITANMKGAMEQFGNAGFAQENLMDVMDDSMGAAAKGLLEASVELKTAVDGMKSLTALEREAADGKSKVPAFAGAIIKGFELATNALASPLGQIVFDLAAILLLMRLGSFGKLGGLLRTGFGMLRGALGIGAAAAASGVAAAGTAAAAATTAASGAAAAGTAAATAGVGAAAAAAGMAAAAGSAATTMAAAAATGYALDGVIGKFGVGLNKLDEKQDELNWQSFSTMEKAESGIARIFETIGGWLFLDNIVNESKAERIKNETEYLKKEKRFQKDKDDLNKKELDAKNRTSEQYLGVTDKGSLSAVTLRNEARSSVNSGNLDAAATIKPDSDKKTDINKKDDSSGSTTVTTTTTSNSRQISLEDVVTKLQEILDATVIDTEQVVRVLSKLKGSNFTNNGNSSNVIR